MMWRVRACVRACVHPGGRARRRSEHKNYSGYINMHADKRTGATWSPHTHNSHENDVHEMRLRAKDSLACERTMSHRLKSTCARLLQHGLHMTLHTSALPHVMRTRTQTQTTCKHAFLVHLVTRACALARARARSRQCALSHVRSRTRSRPLSLELVAAVLKM
uniref:Uncharacterized protein n=1 Tax=Chrysotila carterae TaxID=13221 RepID=A0A6S9XV78_CHRCT|eukprot:6070320-Pleurochrysis_carterae.AAC.2